MIEHLQKRESHGGQVLPCSSGYRLILPTSSHTCYSLAQIDDYLHLTRRKFPHQRPIRFELEARVSRAGLPGTWGFGLWNDPFSMGGLAGGVKRLLPVLPNAAWFFYGSKENSLSLRDDLPGCGFHMKTFCSPLLPSVFSILALPILPGLLIPPAARLLRRVLRTLVKEDAQPLAVDATDWHAYRLTWRCDGVMFEVDGETLFNTGISSQGRMGVVIWIDNQYLLFNSKGKLRYGVLGLRSDQWLEVRHLWLGTT